MVNFWVWCFLCGCSWVIEVNGAPGTLYANETYQLQVDFPEHYPMEAPQVSDSFHSVLLPSFSLWLVGAVWRRNGFEIIVPIFCCLKGKLVRLCVVELAAVRDSKLELLSMIIWIILEMLVFSFSEILLFWWNRWFFSRQLLYILTSIAMGISV